MRGQAYTLEAVIASTLLISSLVFALQVTAVTPLSASTSNQHIENQQRASASGVLTAAQEADVLKPAVLFWNDSEAEFHDTRGRNFYTNDYPPNEFGDILNRSFSGRGLAVNVFVHHGNGTDRMLYNGEPSDNAVAADRMVTLYDDDWLRDDTSSRYKQLSDANDDDLYLESDNQPNNGVYDVVRVEVVVWRM